MSLTKQADEIRRTVETEGRYVALADALKEFDDVISVDKRWRFVPSRVAVSLSTPWIDDDLASVIDAYDAEIVPETLAMVNTSNGDALQFMLEVPPKFVVSGTRKMREYGEYSTSLTFPRESLELAGFDVGTQVDIHAVDGGILLTESDTPEGDE